jgi:hypothetical protein
MYYNYCFHILDQSFSLLKFNLNQRGDNHIFFALFVVINYNSYYV